MKHSKVNWICLKQSGILKLGSEIISEGFPKSCKREFCFQKHKKFAYLFYNVE